MKCLLLLRFFVSILPGYADDDQYHHRVVHDVEDQFRGMTHLPYDVVDQTSVHFRQPRMVDAERQLVKIPLKDVNYKPPYFANRPLPMLAVVPLNAPPGTLVFRLFARDRRYNDIHYFLVRDQSGGRFEVDERTGEVTTLGSDPFMLDKEYVLYVKAEDHNAMTEDGQYQSTGEERLLIMAGRPPAFYMQKYEATIPENQRKDRDIIEVTAKSFADKEIHYILRAVGRGAGTFNIGHLTGIVKLVKDLDYEDLRQPKAYWLMVTATEDSGGLSTSVELMINITDVNDNAPRFELPDYQARNVDEDVAVGTSILQVSASDMDQNKNAEIEYSLDNDDFSIDNKGIIYSNKSLHADINNTYVLTVRATDRGDPPLTGTATVRIYTENRNAEPPELSLDVYTPNVDENAGPNTLVTTVVASDKAGFDGEETVSGMSQIEERTGSVFKSERELRKDIFRDYDKNVRPVKRASTAVPLSVGFMLKKLQTMDEKEKLIVTESIIKMKWIDEYLQWDPSDYDNITQLHIPPFEVWRPDFSLYSAISDTAYFPVVQTNAIIFNNGTVVWTPPFTMKGSCQQFTESSNTKINFIECDMFFGSWTYSENFINIQLQEEIVEMNQFTDNNPDWKFSKAIINRETRLFPCCSGAYSLVHLNITVERRNLIESTSELPNTLGTSII